MRWAVFLGLACGCNSFFGIEATQLIDARPDVPELDAKAPPVCPAIGTQPTFGPDLTMVAARKCSEYSVDAAQGYAVGLCPDITGALVLTAGAVDQPLQPMMMNPVPVTIDSARLEPEGDAIFVTSSTYTSTYETSTTEYRLVDGTWTAGKPAKSPNSTGYNYTLSTPTRGPTRRMVAMLYDSVTYVSYLAELEWNDSELVQVDRTELADLGVDYFYQPSLSPDGLRLIFSGGTTTPQPFGGGAGCLGCGGGYGEQPVYYTDRASIGEKFRKAVVIDSVPSQVSWPFMTEDCGRIYFSALDTVWYLSQ